MSLTRRMIADDFDATDEQIADLNTHKRQMLLDYRAQLAEAGMGKDEIKAEVEAVKKAIQRRRLLAKDAAAVEAREELVDEILTEITSRAPRATRAREIIEEFPPEADEKSTAARKDVRRPAEAAHVASEADREIGEAGGRTRALPAGTQAPPVDTIPAAPEPYAFTPKKLRPHCLHPDRCSGYGPNHCHECSVAAHEAAA